MHDGHRPGRRTQQEPRRGRVDEARSDVAQPLTMASHGTRQQCRGHWPGQVRRQAPPGSARRAHLSSAQECGSRPDHFHFARRAALHSTYSPATSAAVVQRAAPSRPEQQGPNCASRCTRVKATYRELRGFWRRQALVARRRRIERLAARGVMMMNAPALSDWSDMMERYRLIGQTGSTALQSTNRTAAMRCAALEGT